MTFLAPYALFGIALSALPILVHLFKPRKMRATPFSSLRWLKQTRQRLSRRIQWHQWLLFLVRAGIITLLVLALARPLVSSKGEARPVDRVVILDVGRGMGYQTQGEPTPLERAHQLATALVTNSRAGDRTALLAAGARPRLLTPPVADASVHLAALKAIPAGPVEARLGSTLPIVRSLLAEERARDVELVFLTDNQPQAWQQREIQEFLKGPAERLRVRVIDVGPASTRNGWIAEARVVGVDAERLLRVEVACSGDVQERRVRLGDDVRPVTLTPGQPVRVDFRLPAGKVAHVRLEPADGLPGDDELFVNLDPAPLRVLLVETAHPGRDGRGVGLNLRAALEALDAARRHTLEIVGRTAETVAAGEVTRADIVVLAGVPELEAGVVEALVQRVGSGAGLVVFLGDRLQEAFYNQKLHNPLQPGAALLPAPLQLNGEPGQPCGLADVRWSHPLLAPLYDPVLGDLTQARFQRHAGLGALGKNDTVLARFDDGVPALVEHPVGAGRVLLCNTSANDDWTDLPRRKSYVPLVDRIVTYLSCGGVRRSFVVGEPITFPVPTGETVTVTAPSGAVLTPRLIGLRGQTLLHLDEVAEAGAYTLERSGTSALAFVANVGRGPSRAAGLDAKVLEAWWSPVPVEVSADEADALQIGAGAGLWPLWPWLALLAGALLAVETVYVAILCPRVNPAVVDSVVPRRGILKPLAEANEGR